MHDYIAQDNPSAANRLIAEIEDSVHRLIPLPESGRTVPGRAHRGVREILVGNYRIPYQIAPNEIRILRVVHGARRLRILGGLVD